MLSTHTHRGKRVIALRDDDVEGFVIKERFYVCTAAIFYDRHTHKTIIYPHMNTEACTIYIECDAGLRPFHTETVYDFFDSAVRSKVFLQKPQMNLHCQSVSSLRR